MKNTVRDDIRDDIRDGRMLVLIRRRHLYCAAMPARYPGAIPP